MAKRLEVLNVMRMSGTQLQMLLYPGKVMALYSGDVDGQPYMICLIDTGYRHNLPVVMDSLIYTALFGGGVSPGTELNEAQYERVINGLHDALERHEVGQLLRSVLATQQQARQEIR